MATKKMPRRKLSSETRSTDRNSLTPPTFIGKQKDMNKDMDLRYCPVCWSVYFNSGSRSWEFPQEIVKCSKCKHHSIRNILNKENHNSIHSKNLEKDDIPLFLFVKNFLISKKVYQPKILILFPKKGMIEAIDRCFNSSANTVKNRRSGILNRKIVPDIKVITTTKNYDDFISKHIQMSSCIFMKEKYGWKSVVGRHEQIGACVAEAREKFTKFDVILSSSILSHVLEPGKIIREIISSCDYYVCSERRYTSELLRQYTYDLSLEEEKRYYENGMRVSYPISREKYENFICKDQYQYFSSNSLLGLFKNEAISIDRDRLPKGKERSFKCEKIPEVSQNRIIAHNFSSTYLSSL